MILYALVFVLRILLSDGFRRPAIVTATIGRLFQLDHSMTAEFAEGTKLPEWLCNCSGTYRGMPSSTDKGTHLLTKSISISVEEDLSAVKCNHRWPTIVALLSPQRMEDIPACERLNLWIRLEKHFPGQPKDLRAEENIPRLMRSISVLAQWKSSTFRISTQTRLAVISQIGCGSISETLIDNLKYLEKEKNVKQLSNLLALSIHGWLVADMLDSVILRKRRHAKNSYLKFSEFSSIFYRHEKQQKQEWNEARIIIEGSGLYDEAWQPSVYNKTKFVPQKHNYNFSKPIPSGETDEIRKTVPRSSMPYVRKPLNNITAFVGTKLFYEIPPQTFYDAEDGYSRQLKLKLYLRFKQTRTDQQIAFNSDGWIYFLQNEQVIGLQPSKDQVGQHDITICAFDVDMNRICDGVKLFIKKPPPISKDWHTFASPGVVWKYRLPPEWASVVKSDANDSLTISLQTQSLAKLESNFSIVSLITEAFVSKEHKIKIVAESLTTGRTFNYLIVVTMSAFNPYTKASSPEIVLNICHLSLEKVDFEIINHLKDSLITTISRFRSINSFTARDVLLYRIISGREVFLKKSSEDTTLVLSFIYSPKKASVNCTDVYISPELLDTIKVTLAKDFKIFKLKTISLANIAGHCINEERLIENTDKSTTSSLFPVPEPDYREIPSLLNKTINFAVKNGFTFKKIIFFSHEPIIKSIRSMKLLDSNSIPIEESSWVSLSNNQFSIYGLPLSEHVRKQPYLFKLRVALKSGGSETVLVSIVVERFAPRFNHKFGLVISISEQDTVELTRRAGRGMRGGGPPKALGQLLVSQTLPYRWQVVDTLASYLLADQCLVDCGTNIFIYSFSEPKTWQINISWSVVFNSAGFPDYPTKYSVASCSDSKLRSYIRSLMLSDQIPEAIISTFSSLISIFQARPHKGLVKSFQTNHLGTPMWVNVESSGSCSNSLVKPQPDPSGMVLWSNISVFQGSLFSVTLERKRKSAGKETQGLKRHKILFQNGSLCSLKWIRLSEDGRVVYGLPLETDVAVQSYFSLRLVLEYSDPRDTINYYISISVKSRWNESQNTHMVNMSLLLDQDSFDDSEYLNFKIKIARSINGYLHPSCTLGNKSRKNSGYQLMQRDSWRSNLVRFCENAEDIIIHAIHLRTTRKKTVLDLVWSQASVTTQSSLGRPGCDVHILENLSSSLMSNNSLEKGSQELVSFLDNLGIGTLISVQMRLFGDCRASVIQRNINIPSVHKSLDTASKSRLGASESSTKIILGVLCFLTILVIFVCAIVYFVKRGLPSSFTRLRDKGSKSVALEDFTSCPKSPLKSPISAFKKKPKASLNLESIGPSYSSSSPKTPLLSQFSKDDSKFDRHKDQPFSEEDATGSYSYAICHPQSPEPDTSANCSLGTTKQPATSNVIRNPAMMMGSRLNPYRNIPPPII